MSPMAALAAAAVTLTLLSISCARMAVSRNVQALHSSSSASSSSSLSSSRWKQQHSNNVPSDDDDKSRATVSFVGESKARGVDSSSTAPTSSISRSSPSVAGDFFDSGASDNKKHSNRNNTLGGGGLVDDAWKNQPEGPQYPNHHNRRTRNTTADQYFRKHGKLPNPKVKHAVLSAYHDHDDGGDRKDKEDVINNKHDDNPHRPRGVFVIGDVHGCFDELHLLYQKALKANHNAPFQYVILVGDVCNKGPDSAKVVRWVRLQHQSTSSSTRWLTVRGNHDDGALAAALGDDERRQSKKYKWVMDGEGKTNGKNDNNDSENNAFSSTTTTITLSDDDVDWLSQLPYTITIPGRILGESFDTVIVHAGFIPRLDLSQQTIETMITVREVQPVYDDEESEDSAIIGYKYHARDDNHKKKKKEKHTHKNKHHSSDAKDDGEDKYAPRAWAQVWKGPPRVIFGHDARRGLQQHEWAIGLDTGAVYGKRLTGILLPDQKIISVNAVQTHSPVASDGA